jgi:hypothetical protein
MQKIFMEKHIPLFTMLIALIAICLLPFQIIHIKLQ